MSELEIEQIPIELGTISSDMKWEYSYPYLTIGTVAQNYWVSKCEAHDRSTSFDIGDLAKVHKFELKQVIFDDYFWIKVNGHSVYVGPYGGDRAELKNKKHWVGVTTDGEDLKSCELATHWNKAVNIDIKSYLKEGTNEIWTRTVVAGKGMGFLKILATGYKILHSNRISDSEDFYIKLGGDFDF